MIFNNHVLSKNAICAKFITFYLVFQLANLLSLKASAFTIVSNRYLIEKNNHSLIYEKQFFLMLNKRDIEFINMFKKKYEHNFMASYYLESRNSISKHLLIKDSLTTDENKLNYKKSYINENIEVKFNELKFDYLNSNSSENYQLSEFCNLIPATTDTGVANYLYDMTNGKYIFPITDSVKSHYDSLLIKNIDNSHRQIPCKQSIDQYLSSCFYNDSLDFILLEHTINIKKPSNILHDKNRTLQVRNFCLNSTSSIDSSNFNFESPLISTFQVTTPLQVLIQILSPSCYGSLGVITILAQGGSGIYNYYINGNVVNPTSNLVAGTYTVQVSDVLGATFQTIVNINQPTPLNIQTILQAPTCISCLSTLTVNPSGGVPPYVIQVNGQQGGPVFNLIAGVYTVTVIDANACSKTSLVSLFLQLGNIDYSPIKITKNTYAQTAIVTNNSFQYLNRLLYSNVFRNNILPAFKQSSIYDRLYFISPCKPPLFNTFVSSINAMQVTWFPSLDAAHYRLEYRQVNQINWVAYQQVDTAKRITGLLPNTAYIFRLRKTTIYGDTSTWVYQTQTTGAGCLKPQFQSLYVQGNAACLYWSATADSAYRLEYRRLNDVNWLAFLQPNTSKFIQNLTPNTAYICRVKSHCKNKDASDWTYDTIYTTAGCSLPVCQAPIITGTQVYLSWNHPTATQFRLEFQPDQGVSWTSLKLRLPYRTLFNWNPGTMYRYRVRAECANGDISAWVYDSLYVPALRMINDSISINQLDTWVYPNPFSDNIHLKPDDDVVGIKIFDARGRLLITCTPNNTSIPTETWPPGLYFVQAQLANNKIVRTKLIKQ